MKKISFLIFVSALILIQSCRKPGVIHVQNNISSVEITDVRWNKVVLSKGLLPGQTSDKIKITYDQVKLPASHRITFTMKANKKSVYLETEEEFLLQEDQELLIILDDNTKVKNPNE